MYYFMLMPDETVRIFNQYFPVGPLFSIEILAGDSNPSNNKKFKRTYAPAIEEILKPLKPEPQSKATLMKLALFKSHFIKSEPQPKIFGINGRRIGVERIRQGIYFIKTRTGDKKVVIIK